jgi:hypothetical protein
LGQKLPSVLTQCPQERERDEAFQQLKAELERATTQAEQGELIDSDQVFSELREMIEERRRLKAPKR